MNLEIKMSEELFIVVSSPIWNGDLIDSGYLSEPMSWDRAVGIINSSMVEAVIVANGGNEVLTHHEQSRFYYDEILEEFAAYMEDAYSGL